MWQRLMERHPVAFEVINWGVLGLSVVTPLVVFLLGAVWLRERFGLGGWVIIAGLLVGLYSAVAGFRQVIAAMRREAEREEKKSPPTSFNDHS